MLEEKLTLKYRPKKFDEVIGNEPIVTLLNNIIVNKEKQAIPHCLLFSGNSGLGKTTLARIFANKLNNGQGTPIEIDAASNNGVDNVREIIAQANERALDCTYKVIIIDEAHAISQAGFQAFLKTIEEPPAYTIFIFCTTNPQKLPDTIKNRLMQFKLLPVSQEEIEKRLMSICEQEKFTNYNETCKYISRISNGCVRQAIQLLETAASATTDLTISNIANLINTISYDILFDLTNAIIDKLDNKIINIIEQIEKSGVDFNIFLDEFISFNLNLGLYCIFRDMNKINIPEIFKDKVDNTIGIKPTLEESKLWYKKFVNALLDIKEDFKYESNLKAILTIRLLRLTSEY